MHIMGMTPAEIRATEARRMSAPTSAQGVTRTAPSGQIDTKPDPIRMKAMSKTPKIPSKEIFQTDNDPCTTTCPCGNNADNAGFHPCTSKGKDLPNKDPDDAKYFACGNCGKVMKANAVRIIKKTVSITVTSAGMCNSPGLWKLFEHARKTEPKEWCMKFLAAFFNDRATEDQMRAMIQGNYDSTHNDDQSITISVTTE